MGFAIRYLKFVIARLPALQRALRGALYVLLHREQLRKDLLWAWRAFSDFQLTPEERQRLRKMIEEHSRGLGLGGL